MEDNNELVEETTEKVEEQATEELVEGNTEPTTEEVSEPVKTYTDAEVDEMVKKKLFRQKQKLDREYNKELSKYKRAEEVLNAGLGTSNIEDATNSLADFYKEKGITIPEHHETLSEDDIETLAIRDANLIIEDGYEDIVKETDRLAELGMDNMSKREKTIFKMLANERSKIENEKEIAELGISKEEIESEAFKEFSKKLNPSLSLKEKYEMYSQTKPKKIENKMGSMKNGATSVVKEYYSPEEIAKLTEDDLNIPGVYEAVRRSQTMNYKPY